MVDLIFVFWCVFVIAVAISYAMEFGTHKDRFKTAIIDASKLIGWLAVVAIAIAMPLAIFGNC